VSGLAPLFGTALGLAAGAGLNGYAVLLVYGGLARFFPEDFPGALDRILAGSPVLTAVGVLFVLEFLTDKVRALVHLWDVLHVVAWPLAGGLLAAAVVQPHATMPVLVLASGAGALTSLVAHVGKSAARVTSTALTAGIANFALSLAEDWLALLQTLVSLFLPTVALVVVCGLYLLFLLTVPRVARTADIFGRRRRVRA